MRALAIVVLMALAGCTNVVFDSTEYDRMIRAKIIVETNTCANQSFVVELKRLVDEQAVYAAHRAKREQIATASARLKEIVDDYYAQVRTGQSGATFCKRKMENIDAGVSAIVDQMGAL